MQPVLIAVAGGSGSGKTTVSHAILERVGRDRIAYIQHDAYYRDRGNLPLEERARMVAEFTRHNQCDECYVSIRSYLDKTFSQVLWENVSGFFSFGTR